ncbi:hypothetical protein [Salinimicrobium xinjiangense]|uniref:hypothetical protein n=1 Tax=Salinimicrobium xinjiangense TaxID=438596 RepID=UPI000491B61D|nr:hypothetical protein [Salinimicrobium xinjiangense]
MNYLVEHAMSLYVYCTDFLINLANIMNISYYEVNFFVFCLLYPMLLLGSIAFYIVQKRRLRNIKNKTLVTALGTIELLENGK